MSDKAILACWVGMEDMDAALDDLATSDPRYAVLSGLLNEHKDGSFQTSPPRGPLREILAGSFAKGRSENYEEIHVLSTFPESLNEYFKTWLDDPKVQVHTVEPIKADASHIGADTGFKRFVFESHKLLVRMIDKKDRQMSFVMTPEPTIMAGVFVLRGMNPIPKQFLIPHGFKREFRIEDGSAMSIMLREAKDTVLRKLEEWEQEDSRSNLRDARLIYEIECIDQREIRGFEDIVGNSPSLKNAVRKAEKIANSEVTVLLTGESGTGKDRFARAIHRASWRGQHDDGFKKFEAINCASIPKDLLESELYGHDKGGFTGADKDKPGAFERVNGGTLFLDEVGELSLEHQAKLLRVMQPVGDSLCKRRIRRVSGKDEIIVDVRIVAATNRDLFEEIKLGRFRDDLYYRLAQVRLNLPPLRERRNDIELLAKSIMANLNKQLVQANPGYSPKTLTQPALDKLRNQEWPGNVRQLESVLRQTALFSLSAKIGAKDIEATLQDSPKRNKNLFSRPRGEKIDLDKRMREIELDFIEDALTEAGTEEKAGELLGLAQTTLNRKKLNHRNKLKKEG
jgi:two-component system NtrC family response regulator